MRGGPTKRRSVRVTNLETNTTTDHKSLYSAGKSLNVNPGRIKLLDGKSGKIRGVMCHVEILPDEITGETTARVSRGE